MSLNEKHGHCVISQPAINEYPEIPSNENDTREWEAIGENSIVN